MIQLGFYECKLRDVYRVAGVSEQAVSQMRKRNELKIEQMLLINRLVIAYKQSHPGCGMAKMYYQINPPGIGRDNFIKVLRLLGYIASQVSRNHRTTIPGSIRWPNLIEGMLLHNKDQIWQTDLTYYTINGIHYYLIFIIDVYTKVIISHEVSQTMHALHNVRCLKRALKKRKITKINRLVHHSDRGSQYTSIEYISLLLKKNIYRSMGLKGPDNAYAERINGTIKNEYLHHRKIKSYKELKVWTNQAVNHNNTIRIHDSLPNKMAPQTFEKYILNLNYQDRPKVIIYADGNRTIREDSVFINRIPKKDPKVPICPIGFNN